MVLKRLGVLSVGKVLGGIYVVLGLIIGGLFTLLALGGIAVGSGSGSAGAAIFGLGAIILLPLAYGAAGFIGGVILAALYNLVASMLGGIEMEFGYAAPLGRTQAEAATPPPPRTP